MGLAPMIVSFPLKRLGTQSAGGSIRFTPIRYAEEIRICTAPNKLELAYNDLDGNFYPFRPSFSLKELGGEVGDEIEIRIATGNRLRLRLGSTAILPNVCCLANILFTKLDASVVILSCTPSDIYDPKRLSIDEFRSNLVLEVKRNETDTDKVYFYTAKIIELTPEGQLIVAPLSSDSNVAKEIFHLSDERLRPFNFCASHKLHTGNQAILTYEECVKRCELLTGVDTKDLVPLMYFTERQSQGTTHKSVDSATDKSTISVDSANLFEIGMRLEAKDRKNPKMIAVAYVSDVQGSKLKISFDGWDHTDTYDYWCDYRTTDIHPVGYCEFHRVELCAPGKSEKQDFSWTSYIHKNTLTAAPAKAFSVEQSAGSPPFDMLEVVNGLVKRMYFNGPFYYGMRLEAVDRKNPNLICVAHVEDVEQKQLKIAFDGWSTQYDFWCSYDSEDIHPIGYCKHKELVSPLLH